MRANEERGEREVVATKSTSRNNQAGGAFVPGNNNAAGRTSVPPLPADIAENNQTKQAVKQARRAHQPRRLPVVIIIVEDKDECVKGKEERGEREVVATKSTSRNNQAGGALVLGNNAAGRTSVPPLPANVAENNQNKQAVKRTRRARQPRRLPEVIIIVEDKDECVKGKEERGEREVVATKSTSRNNQAGGALVLGNNNAAGRTSVPPLPADVAENNQNKQAVKRTRRARQPRRLPEVIIIVEDEDECVKGKEERGERDVVATKSTSRNNQAEGALVPGNNNAAGRTSVPPLPADARRARQPRRLPEVIIIVEDEDECVKGKEERGEREVVATKSTSRNNQAGGALVPGNNNAAGRTSVPPLPADVSENNQNKQAVKQARRARQPRRLPEVIIIVEDEDECVKGKEERGGREVVATKSTSRNNQAGGALVPGNNNAAGRTSVPPLPADIAENNQTKQAVKQARRARHPRRLPEDIIIVEDECVKGKEERWEREVVASKSTSRNHQAGGALVPARNKAAGRNSVPPLPADVSENNQTQQAVKQARRARQPRRLPEVIIIVEDEDECVKGKEERGEREVFGKYNARRSKPVCHPLPARRFMRTTKAKQAVKAEDWEKHKKHTNKDETRRARQPRRLPEVIIIVEDEDECVKGKEERGEREVVASKSTSRNNQAGGALVPARNDAAGRTSVPPLPADVSENNQTQQAVKQARRARHPRRPPEVIIIVEDECVKGKEERGEREVVATKSTSRNNQAGGALVPARNDAAGRTSVPPLPADVAENNQTKQAVKQTRRARQPRRLPEVIIIVEDEDECVKGKEERGEREVVATKSTSRNNQAGGALVPARNDAAGRTSVPPLPADVAENNQTKQAVKQTRRARQPRRLPEVIIIVEGEGECVKGKEERGGAGSGGY
ncbi:hypothetical protein DVH05_025827 [Phytophthora capsici]|nr:hypothetical protein DVH05_025827 [Phytophthora capsici]